MKKTISAVITAAGNGIRFRGDKMMALIGGQPMLLRTLCQFWQVKEIDEIIVAVRKTDIKKYREIIEKAGFKAKIVAGGPERIISLYNGIKTVKGDLIITHDGCRPLTPVWLIKKLIDGIIKYGAAMTAINPTATIKYVKNFFIKKSLARSETWIAQTPQGFKRELILYALEKAIKEKYFVATDDSELVTRLGEKVRIVPGDEINIKITHPKDVIIAEQLLKFQKYDV